MCTKECSKTALNMERAKLCMQTGLPHMMETGTTTKLKVRASQSMSWVTDTKEISLAICAMDRERVITLITAGIGEFGRTICQ